MKIIITESQLQLLLNEEIEKPNNDSEYITLLTNNGFIKKPHTTDMIWKYENDKTKTYSYKLKNGDIYLGQRMFYNPKNDLSVSGSVINFKLPLTPDNVLTWNNGYNNIIKSKNIYDPSWSLDAIESQLKKINDNLNLMKKEEILKVSDNFIKIIKGVETNINNWLVNPDKVTAIGYLTNTKNLAKEKGLNIS
jgi:hypothetical protein